MCDIFILFSALNSEKKITEMYHETETFFTLVPLTLDVKYRSRRMNEWIFVCRKGLNWGESKATKYQLKDEDHGS